MSNTHTEGYPRTGGYLMLCCDFPQPPCWFTVAEVDTNSPLLSNVINSWSYVNALPGISMKLIYLQISDLYFQCITVATWGKLSPSHIYAFSPEGQCYRRKTTLNITDKILSSISTFKRTVWFSGKCTFNICTWDWHYSHVNLKVWVHKTSHFPWFQSLCSVSQLHNSHSSPSVTLMYRHECTIKFSI